MSHLKSEPIGADSFEQAEGRLDGECLEVNLVAQLRMTLSVRQTIGVGRFVDEFRHLMIFRRIARWNGRNHIVPLAIELFVVALAQLLNLLVDIPCHCGIDGTARLVVSLGIEELTVYLVRTMDGITHHLEEGRALLC